MEILSVETEAGVCRVQVDGPESRHCVVLLPGAADPADAFTEVCARLHNSGLRTVVPESITGLTEANVLAIMDQLKLGWANLVGNREGADLAWRLAGRSFGRFASLVVIDRGHPASPDAAPGLADDTVPAVEVPTTVLVGKTGDGNHAELSGRHVYSEFRVVHLPEIDDVPRDAGHELATEVVLRTSSW